jgi:hypothetical protein
VVEFPLYNPEVQSSKPSMAKRKKERDGGKKEWKEGRKAARKEGN